MLEEIAKLAKQIQATTVKLEEQIGPGVGVSWFERQMEWLGELKDGFREAENKLKEEE